MNALAVFAFGEQVVRISDRDGEPWFVGRDVCAALGHKNPRQVLSRLPDDEKGVLNVDTLGGEQEATIISEPGMYRLVLTSRTEAAERFKKWVVGDVLPAIRRTGQYSPAVPANDAGFAAEFDSEAGCRRIDAKRRLVIAALDVHGDDAARQLWRMVGLPELERGVLPGGAIPSQMLAAAHAAERAAKDAERSDYLETPRYQGSGRGGMVR